MAPLSFARLLLTRLDARSQWLAGAALAGAAFNLAFRIGNETVQVWDESLYAITAGEVVASGDWIGTTFLGTLDYYNSKPPLNVWLIALSFKAFGAGLVSLRLPAITAAWLTVALLFWWARRCFGPAIAVVSSLVLATSYGFLYVHSGRTANPDALLALFVLLTVVTLWAARDHAWRRIWLGPLLAAVFLLKGMAVAMPLAIVSGVEMASRRPARAAWLPLAAAFGLFSILVGPWAIARWQLDQAEFFHRLFFQDFLSLMTEANGHDESLLFYFDVLQKYHYDWLVAAMVALVCLPNRRARIRALFIWDGTNRPMLPLLLSWGAATVLLPTMMVTKVGWYLNSFYPLFALIVAWVITQAWSASLATQSRRVTVVAGVTVLAFGVAESKLWWHSYQKLDLRRSAQGLFLAERSSLIGQRVYAREWSHSDRFVVRTVGGHCEIAADVDAFLATSRPGDYWLGNAAAAPHLVPVASTGRQTLYRRAN